MQKLGYCEHYVKVAITFNQSIVLKIIANIMNTPFYYRLHDFVLRHCIQHVRKELEMV